MAASGEGRRFVPLGAVARRSLVIAVGSWFAWRFVGYAMGLRGVGHFHVETAGLVLAAVLIGSRCLLAPPCLPAYLVPARASVIAAFTAVAGAMLLYWPALRLGFLSDDFPLSRTAEAGHIFAGSVEFFRPVPLAIWTALLHVHAGPWTLHFLNVVVHGINAYLVGRLARAWFGHAVPGFLAGMAFLTSPLAPEAVAWCAGVFDVVSTLLILLAATAARRYATSPTLATRLIVAALLIAGMLSKETAAIGPALILVDALLRRATDRRLWLDMTALTGLSVVMGLFRLYAAHSTATLVIDRYRLSQLVFGTFGTLAIPLHISVITALPGLRVGLGLALLTALVSFSLRPSSGVWTLRALTGPVWVLVSMAPVLPIFSMSPDLQTSRYLYLPFIGWSILVTTLIAHRSVAKSLWPWSVSILAGLCVMNVFVTRAHLHHWREAAELRDYVQRVAGSDPRMRGCPVMLSAASARNTRRGRARRHRAD